MTEGALPGASAAVFSVSVERLAQAHLSRLSREVDRAEPAAERDLLRSLGWLVASPADAQLPVRAAARLIAGASTHPSMQSLARFLMMRSVRCRRLGRSYLEQARVALHLQREKLQGDPRPAFWSGVLHLLEGRLSEARRQLETAERLGGSDPPVVVAAACADLLLTDARTFAPRQRDRMRLAAGLDPVVSVLERSLAGNRAQPGRSLRLEFEWRVSPDGALLWPPEGVGGAPAAPPSEGDTGLHDSARVVHVQGVALSPVAVRGAGGTHALSALEGELLLAFLSLLSVKPGDDGSPSGTFADRPFTRDVWAGAIWPSTPGSVGRLDGVFSAAIRSLRLKLEAACSGPVIEVSRRGGYRLVPGTRVRLRMDVPALAGNWLLSRVPAPGRPEVP